MAFEDPAAPWYDENTGTPLTVARLIEGTLAALAEYAEKVAGIPVLAMGEDPTEDQGEDGNYAFVTPKGTLWGPKAGGKWPTPPVLLGGLPFLSGESIPPDDVGGDGDIFIHTVEWAVYLKAAGHWSKKASLIGPPGDTGKPGGALTPSGPWSAETAYPQFALVTRAGGSYYAAAGNIGADPLTDVTGKWALFASPGAQGGLTSPFGGWMPTGAKIETIPRRNVTGALTIATGKLYLASLPTPLLAGQKYSSITFRSGPTALVAGTHQWFALVSRSERKILRATVDDLATAWLKESPKTLALSSAYTPGADTDAYLAIVVAAGTPPNVRSNNAQIADVIGAEPALAGESSTGQTIPLADGSVVAAPTATTQFLYGYVS